MDYVLDDTIHDDPDYESLFYMALHNLSNLTHVIESFLSMSDVAKEKYGQFLIGNETDENTALADAIENKFIDINNNIAAFIEEHATSSKVSDD